MGFLVGLIAGFMKIGIQMALAIASAIPFMYSWNAVVPVYFAAYVPEQLHNISYWHFVAIILVFSFLGEQIQKITPKLISVDQSVENK